MRMSIDDEVPGTCSCVVRDIHVLYGVLNCKLKNEYDDGEMVVMRHADGRYQRYPTTTHDDDDHYSIFII